MKLKNENSDRFYDTSFSLISYFTSLDSEDTGIFSHFCLSYNTRYNERRAWEPNDFVHVQP